MTILRANNLKKVYTTRFGAHHVQALANVSFSVERGEYVAIMGESGSGKTTLLNILAALDKPTSGEVWLGDRKLTDIPEKELAAFRRDNLGFVFQEFNLLDTFSVRDNIYLPLVLKRMSADDMSLTQTLEEELQRWKVNLLEHFIIAGDKYSLMSEMLPQRRRILSVRDDGAIPLTRAADPDPDDFYPPSGEPDW